MGARLVDKIKAHAFSIQQRGFFKIPVGYICIYCVCWFIGENSVARNLCFSSQEEHGGSIWGVLMELEKRGVF